MKENTNNTVITPAASDDGKSTLGAVKKPKVELKEPDAICELCKGLGVVERNVCGKCNGTGLASKGRSPLPR